MPPVVHRTRDEDDDVSSEKLTLKELRESDKSYLLIGEKETGKTTLLERLFVEINENTSLTNEVPVLIDINELGNRDIITKIKDFFHINTSKAEYICNNSSIVLLIDDIDFSESYDIELSNILEFKENYDDVRIIATTDKKHKGDIAIDRYDAEKLSDFNIVPLEIQKFKVDQIKGLIHRWFGEEYVKEKSGKIDDLVKLFGSLDIPRTPLSVSIFLWIFEKQEEYRPTNKSTMVENFVEKLFDKHSPSEALSAKFDYKNKQRLLANIAKYMEENGGNSYRVILPIRFWMDLQM
jgi:GTPase SAR1 family protein